MNYSRAFSYVFEDKNWASKLLIAGLISLIPIVGQFYLLGWVVEIVRRVKAGRVDVLPTTHFSYFLTLGLKMFVVSLIYSIPVVILSCIITLINGRAEYADGSLTVAIYTSMGCFGSILTFVINCVVALLGTYGMIKLAQTDQIKACLDFGDAYRTIKANISAFIIVGLLSIVAGLIESAGLILCFIGIIFTVPYGTAIVGHLVGQLWDNLKNTDNNRKPYRGVVQNEVNNVADEAPFTKVQDIENYQSTPESVNNDIQEAVIVDEEPIAESADPAEDILTDISETEKAEPSENKPEDQNPDEGSNDDDLPSFE